FARARILMQFFSPARCGSFPPAWGSVDSRQGKVAAMSRSSWLLAGAVLTVPALVFGVMSISGSGTNPPTGSIPGGGTGGKEPKPNPRPEGPASDLKPVLDGWKKPAAVVVLSGEQHGYFEPCGCTDTQSGGASRRADLFLQLADKGWPATGLDLGGIPK